MTYLQTMSTRLLATRLLATRLLATRLLGIELPGEMKGRFQPRGATRQ